MSVRVCNNPDCGYPMDHPKHYRNCVDKPSWPSWMLDRTVAMPMPQVEVAIAEARGIVRVPVMVAERETAELTIPHVEAGQPLPPLPKIPQIGGACCAHPVQVHIANAEGFPPVCMECPEQGAVDEHEWQPMAVSEEASVLGSDVLPNVADAGASLSSEAAFTCLVCGRVSASLTGNRSHQRAHQRRSEN